MTQVILINEAGIEMSRKKSINLYKRLVTINFIQYSKIISKYFEQSLVELMTTSE